MARSSTLASRMKLYLSSSTKQLAEGETSLSLAGAGPRPARALTSTTVDLDQLSPENSLLSSSPQGGGGGGGRVTSGSSKAYLWIHSLRRRWLCEMPLVHSSSCPHQSAYERVLLLLGCQKFVVEENESHTVVMCMLMWLLYVGNIIESDLIWSSDWALPQLPKPPRHLSPSLIPSPSPLTQLPTLPPPIRHSVDQWGRRWSSTQPMGLNSDASPS